MRYLALVALLVFLAVPFVVVMLAVWVNRRARSWIGKSGLDRGFAGAHILETRGYVSRSWIDSVWLKPWWFGLRLQRRRLQSEPAIQEEVGVAAW